MKCPKCGSDQIETTLAGYFGKDTNKAYCHRCEWVGIAQDAKPPPELEIGMYAGAARSLGLEVPEHVPDCAKLEPLNMTTVDARELDDGRVIVDITVRAAWSWVEGKFEITI